MPYYFNKISKEELNKNIEIEYLIEIFKETLLNQKWIIIDVRIERNSNLNTCCLDFKGGIFGPRYTNKGTISIYHWHKEGLSEINLNGECSIFRDGDWLGMNMQELFLQLKLDAFSVKETKKKHEPNFSSKKNKNSVSIELEKIVTLFEKGILTKSEFTKAKKKLLA